MTKAQTVQNHGLDRLSDGNHTLFVILNDDRIDELDDAQFIHHRRDQSQVVQIVALILDYQVFYFDKVGTCGLCHACGCPIFQ